MSAGKTDVYSTFDTVFGTWNVIGADNQCLFYGSVDGLESWLSENEDKYKEVRG